MSTLLLLGSIALLVIGVSAAAVLFATRKHDTT